MHDAVRTLLVCIALPLFASCQDASLATSSGAPVIDLTGRPEAAAIGETRRILFGAGDRTLLLDGWSQIDERNPELDLTFVWATEVEASVSFQVLDVVAQQLLVKLSAFPRVDPQMITVLVNGEQVSRFEAQPMFLEHRFVAPARVLRRGDNRLTFRHEGLPPQRDSPDHRRLAAAYHSILIGPECLPLRGFGLPPRPRVYRQGPTKTTPAALVVTGPATLRRRLRVPAGGVLRYHAFLEAPGRAPAVATVRIFEDETTHDLSETRLASGLFGGGRSRDVEVDLSPWSGKKVELEIEVRPDTCRTPVTTVVIDRAGIFSR